MSETPRTDALIGRNRKLDTMGDVAMYLAEVAESHADLERELSAARRERDEARALNAESFCCGGDDACAGGAGCQCHALRAEVESAKPAMREYAAKNPRHHFGETWQDPCGVHAWLERNDKPEPTT